MNGSGNVVSQWAPACEPGQYLTSSGKCQTATQACSSSGGTVVDITPAQLSSFIYSKGTAQVTDPDAQALIASLRRHEQHQFIANIVLIVALAILVLSRIVRRLK
jgi:hypothetical protein